MSIHTFDKLYFIHGWLFGSNIWTDIRPLFRNIASHQVVTLSGYSRHTNTDNDIDRINAIIKHLKHNEVIIAYSYGASLIMASNYLKKCKAKIFLINPFFSPRKGSIKSLVSSLQSNYNESIKKFIYEAVKSKNSTKSNYSKLLESTKNQTIPTIDTLIDNLITLDKLNFSLDCGANICIIQSMNDQINNLDIFHLMEKANFNTFRVNNLPHYPFFNFQNIFNIIKSRI